MVIAGHLTATSKRATAKNPGRSSAFRWLLPPGRRESVAHRALLASLCEPGSQEAMPWRNAHFKHSRLPLSAPSDVTTVVI